MPRKCYVTMPGKPLHYAPSGLQLWFTQGYAKPGGNDFTVAYMSADEGAFEAVVKATSQWAMDHVEPYGFVIQNMLDTYDAADDDCLFLPYAVGLAVLEHFRFVCKEIG